MSRHFSSRYGYSSLDAEITVRKDAPDDLRYSIVEIARAAGMSLKAIRAITCRVLFVAPDRNNWSDFNIRDELEGLLGSCDWCKVYDVAEDLWRALEQNYDGQQLFANELNRFFREKGIGWELEGPGWDRLPRQREFCRDDERGGASTDGRRPCDCGERDSRGVARYLAATGAGPDRRNPACNRSA